MDNNLPQNNIQPGLPPQKPSIWVANPHLKMLLLVLIFTFLASGIGLAVLAQVGNQYREKIYLQTEAGLPKHQVKTSSAPTSLADGRLQVDSPKEGDTVGQTFTISGYAQSWFEGNISIKIFDDTAKLLYQGNAIAGDNYDHPAPFTSSITLAATSTTPEGNIQFDDYSAKDGSLVYQKYVGVKFSNIDNATAWKTYKNNQFGFQLKYPSNWTVKTVSGELNQNHQPTVEFSSTAIDFARYPSFAVFPVVTVDLGPILDSNVLNAIDVNNYSSYTLPNGIVAKRKLGGGDVQKIQWILFDNNYFMTIMFSYDVASLKGKFMDENEYTNYTAGEQAIINGILSTIKFTK